MWLKIALAALAVLTIIAALLFWHLKVVYESWVASTSKGEPLFERSLLETYGDQIIADLVRKDVQLAIISRAGQPRKQLPPGIDYTHSAFWVYSPVTDADGTETPGYAVYNLYHNEDNRLISRLETDAAADFLKLTREHDVGVIIPNIATQNMLIDYIQSPRYADMHQTHYSLISNPLDPRFQNCNEFMLDAMAAAFVKTQDRAVVKASFQDTLETATIKASIIRRTLGPRIDERLIMADQDTVIKTTTRQTLAKFLKSAGRLDAAYVLELRAE